MSEPVIQRWVRVIHKNAVPRTESILETSFLNQADIYCNARCQQEYNIPKSAVKPLMDQNFTFPYHSLKF